MLVTGKGKVKEGSAERTSCRRRPDSDEKEERDLNPSTVPLLCPGKSVKSKTRGR